MRNRNSNIILRGTAILLLSIALILAIVSLTGYSRQRDYYPSGMTIAGVPVGGLDPQAASQRVLQVYSSPIQIQYNGGIIQVDPAVIGFQMDMESMLAAADLRPHRRFFLGRILGLPVESECRNRCRFR